MSPRSKLLLVVAVLTVFVVGATVAAYAAWHREGVIQVEVSSLDGWGTEANIIVPGALVPIVMNFVPDVAFCDGNDEDWREAREYMPLVSKIWKELRNGPDGVYVAVDGSSERVRIAKEGEYLLIDVIDDNEHVKVRCPVRTIDAVTDRMARMGRSWI